MLFNLPITRKAEQQFWVAGKRTMSNGKESRLLASITTTNPERL
jgi:hypothetical protein